MAKEFSYHKHSGLLSADEINSLNALYEKIETENKYESAYPNVRELGEGAITQEPILNALRQKITALFEEEIDVSGLRFDKLWFVSSTSDDTDKKRLPYITHFDKRRYLKAMVYLHDVSMEHGPIHFGEMKQGVDIEARRHALPPDYKAKGLNSIENFDLEEETAPVLGKAGDVILFDTNAAHKAGIVSEGFCRKVLRFDFELPSFNTKPTLMERLLYKFKQLS